MKSGGCSTICRLSGRIAITLVSFRKRMATSRQCNGAPGGNGSSLNSAGRSKTPSMASPSRTWAGAVLGCFACQISPYATNHELAVSSSAIGGRLVWPEHLANVG